LESPKRKKRGRGRSARQISLPSAKWILADIMVEKYPEKYKDVSALFEKAFDRQADEDGMALNIELKELGSKIKSR
jgi:hypothetical protein